jgi:coenzyme PQQ precursor peptide PqqA
LALVEITKANVAQEEARMAWETPIVTEIAVGMEVTSYVSGEDEVLL